MYCLTYCNRLHLCIFLDQITTWGETFSFLYCFKPLYFFSLYVLIIVSDAQNVVTAPKTYLESF